MRRADPMVRTGRHRSTAKPLGGLSDSRRLRRRAIASFDGDSLPSMRQAAGAKGEAAPTWIRLTCRYYPKALVTPRRSRSQLA